MKIYKYSSEYETVLILEYHTHVEFWIERLTYMFLWKVHNLKEEPIDWFIFNIKNKIDYVFSMMFIRNKFQYEYFVETQLMLTLESLQKISASDFKIFEEKTISAV